MVFNGEMQALSLNCGNMGFQKNLEVYRKASELVKFVKPDLILTMRVPEREASNALSVLQP
jgi:hypothetical protein